MRLIPRLPRWLTCLFHGHKWCITPPTAPPNVEVDRWRMNRKCRVCGAKQSFENSLIGMAWYNGEWVYIEATGQWAIEYRGKLYEASE